MLLYIAPWLKPLGGGNFGERTHNPQHLLSVDEDADAAVEARIRIGWNKFRQCLPMGIYNWLGEGGCLAVVCKVLYYTQVRPGLSGNKKSSSGIAERLRSAYWTSNRKLVKKIAFVRWKSISVSDFWRGWVTSIAHFRWKGTSPTNHCWMAEN